MPFKSPKILKIKQKHISHHCQNNIKGFMEYLAETYDFVSIESIGLSYEGRDMKVTICFGVFFMSEHNS